MTKLIGERITIREFYDGLSTITFDEVTEDRLKELFPNAHVEFVNEIRDNNLKDISIDDYTFTIERITDKEQCPYYFTLNNSMRLGTDVEVWLPTDHIGSMDIQANGTIHFGDDFYMTIQYDID